MKSIVTTHVLAFWKTSYFSHAEKKNVKNDFSYHVVDS